MVLFAKTVTIANATTLNETTAEPNLPQFRLPTTGYLTGVEVALGAASAGGPVYAEPTLFYTDLAGILLTHGWMRNDGVFNDDCLFWTGRLSLSQSISTTGPFIRVRMRNDSNASRVVAIAALVEPA